MTGKIYLFSLLTIIIVGRADFFEIEEKIDQKLPLKCIPKKIFAYDHNICFCNDEGAEITCKRKIYTELTPELHYAQLQNITTDCDPESLFQLPCKECLCHKSGKYASCIQTECSGEDIVPETPKNCTPGSVFNELCNGCICGSDGKAACTNLDCKVIGWEISEIQCVPFSHLMFKCNECDCASDGKTMSCDRMGCNYMSFYHEHLLNVTMNCQNGTIFDYNCHRCFCDKDGNYAMCSGVPCPHKYDFIEVKDTEENCNPGMIFAKDCNVCVCGENRKGICTSFSCSTSYNFKYFEHLNFVIPST